MTLVKINIREGFIVSIKNSALVSILFILFGKFLENIMKNLLGVLSLFFVFVIQLLMPLVDSIVQI